jgi:hypothetical protein
MRNDRPPSWPLLPALFAVSLMGCDEKSRVFQPPVIEDGLIYTHPLDGTVDLPLGSKALFVFSHQVDAGALTQNCTGTAEAPAGAFCITGPDGLVPTAADTEVVNDGRTISFSMASLTPGTRYQVWLRPAAAPGAVNLPATGPLLSFRTRQARPVPDQAPTVIAINQEDPLSFVEGSGVTPRFPFMDVTPIRVTFSEPLAQSTLVSGESFRLLKDGQPVPVSVHAERHYLSIQPLQDLDAGARYTLELDTDITDLQRESLAGPTTFLFEPLSSKNDPADDNPPIRQLLSVFPTENDPGFPLASRLTDKQLNRFSLVNPVLGDNEVQAIPETLEAWLADPVRFPVEVPILARGGQQLRLTGINPARLGGEVDLGLSTGDISGVFINNVSAWLLPNPFRPAGTNPDDELAPLLTVMNFDLAMQGGDASGNATFNQNLMHIQAPGIVTVKDGALNIELFTTLQLDVLGGATAITADFNLGVRSDESFTLDRDNDAAPRVTGSFPEDLAVGVETRDNLLLILSEALGDTALDRIVLRDLSAGTEVPIRVSREGTTLVVSPRQPLAEATPHALTLPPDLSDNHLFAPRPLAALADDALGGDNTLTFTTADYTRDESGQIPPLLLGVYPGVGCALIDVGTLPGKAGRCDGGLPTDVQYEPFRYEVGTPIDITFSQPMDTESLRVGTISAAGDACTGGAVCLARLQDGGWAPIALGVHAENMAIQLSPADGSIVAGNDYRLVINGSGETFRNQAELGHLAINTRPLASVETPGGPNVVIDFEAVPKRSTIFSTIRTRPFSDTNGNGFFDNAESEALANSARLRIDGTGGVITSASYSDPERDRLFISGALPVGFMPLEPLDLSVPGADMISDGPNRWCTPPEVDAYGESQCFNTVGSFMTPVEIGPQVVLGTSLSLDATALVVPINGLATRALVLRVRSRDQGPVYGYVFNEAGQDKPQFLLRLEVYLDAPDIVILGGLAASDLRSTPITTYVKGPISFLDDGRITLDSSNISTIAQGINLSIAEDGTAGPLDPVCGLPVLGPILCGILEPVLTFRLGNVDLIIERGDFNIKVVTHPSRGLRLAAPAAQ